MMIGSGFDPAAPGPGKEVAVFSLRHWMSCIDAHLRRGDADQARVALQGLLARRPWHLPAYEQALTLVQLSGGSLERASFARRLLQADPLSAAAHESLADVGQGRTTRVWRQRLWQMHPFEAGRRAGWRDQGGDLALDQPALAFTFFRCQRWEAAAREFAELLELDAERDDWQAALLVCMARLHNADRTLEMARTAVHGNRFLIAGWYVLSEVGEDADREVAGTYIDLLDADGQWAAVRPALGFESVESGVTQLDVPAAHAMLRRSLELEEPDSA